MLDPIESFRLARQAPIHEQITAFLRQQILSGTITAGSTLPATPLLARQFGVSITVIQAAVAPLALEGLIVRKPRVGTIVRGRAASLGRIGVYRISDPHREARPHFARSLADFLTVQLKQNGASVIPMTEVRDPGNRMEMSKELAVALQSRVVDGVIACETDPTAYALLTQAQAPVALYGMASHPRVISHDFHQFIEVGISSLKQRGCSSVGLISILPTNASEADGTPHCCNDLRGRFVTHATSEGLIVEPRWLCTPEVTNSVLEFEAERFGYESMLRIWTGETKPDGLLIYTDLAARGAVMGLLSCEVKGTVRPHLVIHRNNEMDMFCPIPVDVMEVSIEATAKALIESIKHQASGHQPTWRQLPFHLTPHP